MRADTASLTPGAQLHSGADVRKRHRMTIAQNTKCTFSHAKYTGLRDGSEFGPTCGMAMFGHDVLSVTRHHERRTHHLSVRGSRMYCMHSITMDDYG